MLLTVNKIKFKYHYDSYRRQCEEVVPSRCRAICPVIALISYVAGLSGRIRRDPMDVPPRLMNLLRRRFRLRGAWDVYYGELILRYNVRTRTVYIEEHS